MSSFIAGKLSKLYHKLVTPEASKVPDDSVLEPIDQKWYERDAELERKHGKMGNVPIMKMYEHEKVIEDTFHVKVDQDNVLGKGGFGWVYASKDFFGRQYALKVMTPRFDDEDWLRNFFFKIVEQEIYHSVSLKHANIVRMYDYRFMDKPYHVIFKMELLGPTLHKLVLYPLTIKNIQKIINEIGSAISYMHSHGTAHHDIKLENIMITGKIDTEYPTLMNLAIAKQKFKLCDFGLVQKYSTDPPVETNFRSGSRLFCSPEKFDADSYNPFKSDHYAFGLSLFIALIGRIKFKDGKEIAERDESLWHSANRIIMAKVAEKLVANTETGNEREKEAIIGLLNYDPDERMTIDQVAEVFKNI